jgi:hypothetical protein
VSEAEIEFMMRKSWDIPPESRLDVVLTSNGAFRATEVKPDLSVGKRINGTICIGGEIAANGHTISSDEEPDLRLPQLALYEAIRADWSKRMLESEAKADGRTKFFLMREGDYPALFPSLKTHPSNVNANVNEGMKEVYQALDSVLFNHGYLVNRSDMDGIATELWAHPRRFY